MVRLFVKLTAVPGMRSAMVSEPRLCLGKARATIESIRWV